jgi:hypothetical protein
VTGHRAFTGERPDRTWADLVVEVWQQWGFHGPLADFEVDYVLWEETAFPLADSETVRRQASEFFIFQAMPAPRGAHAGRSRCPMCGLRWWVTPANDCLLPACGCYGNVTGPENPERPCHRCGLTHAVRCKQKAEVAS